MTFTSFFEANRDTLHDRVFTFNCLISDAKQYANVYTAAKEVTVAMLQKASWFMDFEKYGKNDPAAFRNAMFAAGYVSALYTSLMNKVAETADDDFFGKSYISLIVELFEEIKKLMDGCL